MGKKKIAITANSAWSAWVMRRKFARELKMAGYDIYFVVGYDEKYSNLLAEEFYVQDIHLKPNDKNPFSDLKSLYSYFSALKKIKPDVLLNYHVKPNIYATLTGKLLGIKIINNVAGLGSVFIKGGILANVIKILYKLAFTCSSLVFFQNSDDLNQFIDNKIVNKNKTDLLPGSGVDLEKFLPREKKLKNKKFRFLMLSRLILDKGIVELAKASEILKKQGLEYEIYLIGDLDLHDKRSVLKNELDLWQEKNLIKHFEFIDDIRDEIAKSDCVVLPSYREGKPRSLLEASAMGKPTIATNVPGCKDVVEDGKNGFLCEVRNAKDLALKMKKMMNLSDEERNAMGRYAREKMCKEFDEKIVIEKYKKAIEKILHSKN